jgi:hypothetical protein
MDFLSVGSTEIDKEDTLNFGGKPFGKCTHKTQGRRREDNIKEQTSCEVRNGWNYLRTMPNLDLRKTK